MTKETVHHLRTLVNTPTPQLHHTGPETPHRPLADHPGDPHRETFGTTSSTEPPVQQCATLCDMRTVTHREMRNQSGEILREVADGETIQVTNHGQVGR